MASSLVMKLQYMLIYALKCSKVSFLGFMETSPAIEIPDISDEEISSMPETNKALLPLCDMLRPLIAKL